MSCTEQRENSRICHKLNLSSNTKDDKFLAACHYSHAIRKDEVATKAKTFYCVKFQRLKNIYRIHRTFKRAVQGNRSTGNEG
jgi:hypothetical protein